MSSRRDVASICADIRQTRISIGLSIKAAGESVGLHPSTFGRIERVELACVTVEQLALACAAVGNRLSLRAYPADDPARDAGQLRLLARLRARIPTGISWQTEVPMQIPGDSRAFDAVVVMNSTRIGVEAESRLGDLQAIERRARLKKRDAGVDRLILLVADTRANRKALELHREELRGSFPLGTRDVLAALGGLDALPADGIVVL